MPLHFGEPLDEFCAQLGFEGFGGVTYGLRPCLAPAGAVWWCSGYDEPGWHWCDYSDGYWLGQSLDFHACDDEVIASLTCF